MQLDGINGEVSSKGFEQHIELDSYSFGVSKKVNQIAGNVTNREGSIPTFSAFTVTQKVDPTSPVVFQNIVKSSLIKTVVIKCAATDGRLYHTITLSDVLVSSYNEDWAAVTSSENHITPKPIATITFHYNKIEVQFTPLGKDHKAGSPVSAGYDLELAQAA
jgi:type VI secretion system secreted protein Hcp